MLTNQIQKHIKEVMINTLLNTTFNITKIKRKPYRIDTEKKIWQNSTPTQDKTLEESALGGKGR